MADTSEYAQGNGVHEPRFTHHDLPISDWLKDHMWLVVDNHLGLADNQC